MVLKSSVAIKEANCDMLDIFITDPRPTLIIDTQNENSARGVQVEFANDAFTRQYGVILRFLLSGQILEPDFIQWLKEAEPRIDEYLLGDLTWQYFVLHGRWKVATVAPTHQAGHLDHLDLGKDDALAATESDGHKPPLQTQNSDPVATKQTTTTGLTVALPSGLVSLGSAPTALEGLHRSVDMLDVGFFEYDLDGTLIYANKSWYSLSGHPYDPDGHTEKRFLDLCHPDDIEVVTNAWMQLAKGKPITFEMRWKHQNTPLAHALGGQWVQAACIPLYDEKGNTKSITGCTTDINNQKYNENIANSRAEALERARTFEQRFVKFAAVAPIVVFNLDADKNMTYCNDRWFEVTATSKKAFEAIDVAEGFCEEGQVKLFSIVDESIKNREVNTAELRVNKAWYASDGRRAQAWVLASIFAEFTNEGTVQGCTGTLTDISEFKYAETLQRTRLNDAIEAKRQQENFIDMTSHEMRNPLSAMVQCADSALGAVSELSLLIKSVTAPDDIFIPQLVTQTRLIEEVDLAIDGLQTIVSCCAHQKCIIDDVLTLSKLDSNLVSITPVATEPSQVMHEVVKMFEMDAQNADVQLSTNVDKSLNMFNIKWLMFDPSRVKQILINLMSNAIKFTRTEDIREVVLTMCASLEQPTSGADGRIKYAPPSRPVPDGLLAEPEWGTGQVVYLQFSLQDTGRGLTEAELQKMFHRFSQASPKTHVQYGGSGLGLFITRQLAELQGGEIGVASEKDKGSIFAFYIQARKTTDPEPGRDGLTLSGSSPMGRTSSHPHRTPSIAGSMDVASNIVLDKPRRIDHSRRPSPSPPQKVTTSLPPSITTQPWQPTVLIVEDNMVNQKVLSTQLKRLGCHVAVAGHGLEALEFLKTTDLWHPEYVSSDSSTLTLAPTLSRHGTIIDVILMDIEMPVMGGLACTRAIRDLEHKGIIQRPARRAYEHDRLPIISISANVRSEQSNEQREAGVDDIITKPFRIPQLMDKIWRLTGKREVTEDEKREEKEKEQEEEARDKTVLRLSKRPPVTSRESMP